MNKHYIIRLLIIVFLVLNCVRMSAQTNEIYHLSYSHNNPAIIFDADGTFAIIEKPCNLCYTFGRNDTVSFGKYVKYKNEKYFLFSDPIATGNHVYADVEENIRVPKDSLLIVLKGLAFEQTNDVLFSEDNTIVYIINIWYAGEEGDFSEKFIHQKIVMQTDSIVVPKQSTHAIEMIRIDIACHCLNAQRPLQYVYKTKHLESNSFVFSFKDVSYNRFFYRSFFAEPVLIIDDNTIDFDRMLFQKEEKRIRRYPKGKKYYDVFCKVKDPYHNDNE